MAAEIRSTSEIRMPKGYYFGPQDPVVAAEMEEARRAHTQFLIDLNARLNEQKARCKHVRTE